MRTAALYDIHGNLPALEAVLKDIDAAGVERILIGGDVAYGPLVGETLERLFRLGDRALWIRGNADRELVEFYDTGTTRNSVPEDQLRALAWETRSLGGDHRDFLAALPARRTLSVEGLGPVLFCHGSPRSDEEIITSLTSEERLGRLLKGVKERTVVCGHTHVQFDRQLGDFRLANAGSVGLPYQCPGAYWALLGPGLTLQRTAYDLEHAAALFRASGHPLGDTFAQQLGQPFASEKVITHFEQVALQRDASPARGEEH